MIELEINEVRKIQFKLLIEFVEFCDKHQIRYFLCGGTLLGAVRHKGFIPWDDDIDVMMPRKDYIRFIELYKNNNHCTLLAGTYTKSFPFPYAKLSDNQTILKEESSIEFEIGVNIDIFPIDGMSSDENKFKKQLKRINFYRFFWQHKASKLNITKEVSSFPKKILKKIVISLLTYGFLIKRINRIAMSFDFDKSDYSGILVWGYGVKERCRKIVFKNDLKIEFEGQFFNAPGGYKEYLQNVYGDFMKLPDINKRISHHSFKAYSKV